MEYSVYSSTKHGYILAPKHLETNFFTIAKGPMFKVHGDTTMKRIKHVALLRKKSTSLIPILITVNEKDKKLSIADYIRKHMTEWDISFEKANLLKRQLANAKNEEYIEETKSAKVPKDIVKDTFSTVKKQVEISKENKDSELLENIEYTPLPSNTIVSSSADERPYLSTHINYYLKDLGLKTFTQSTLLDSDKIFRFSTKGDSLAKLIVLEKTDDYEFSSKFLQNENMAYAMMRLGYKEFTGTTTHLSGTFFETLLQVAYKQKNDRVLSELLEALIGKVAYWEDEPEDSLFDSESIFDEASEPEGPNDTVELEENIDKSETIKDRTIKDLEDNKPQIHREVNLESAEDNFEDKYVATISVYPSDSGDMTVVLEPITDDDFLDEGTAEVKIREYDPSTALYSKKINLEESLAFSGLNNIQEEDAKINPDPKAEKFKVDFKLVERLLNSLSKIGVTKSQITSFVDIGVPASKFSRLTSASVNVHSKLVDLVKVTVLFGGDGDMVENSNILEALSKTKEPERI